MPKKVIDKILLICTVSLIVLGALMVFSVSAPFSQGKFGKSYYFLSHQLLFGILPGAFLGFLAFKIKISLLKKLALILFLLNLIFLSMVFFPEIGAASGGARRWVKLGPLTFQPSEFLKITLFCYLAAFLAGKKKEKNLIFLATFLIILIPVALLLISQPDISTLAVILFVAFLIYFLDESPFWHSFLTISIAIAILLFLIYLAPYRMERFLTFFEPGFDPMGAGFQVKQAQISIGSGGLFGKGFGMSKQKFGLLPHPMSDSIFAIFAEEGGFLGSLILIFLFLIFLQRGFKIAKESDRFCRLLALAITLQIGLQAFLHMGAMIGILPLTGIPLPFISYGGTHTIVELIGVGILLNISKHA